MRDERNNESLMDETGLGLLPGLAGALGIVVGAMVLLLIGSMWAVFGVLVLVADRDPGDPRGRHRAGRRGRRDR